MEVLVLSLVTNNVVIPDKYVSPREEFESEVSIFFLPFLSFPFPPIIFIDAEVAETETESVFFTQLAAAGRLINIKVEQEQDGEEDEVSHSEVLNVGKKKADDVRLLVEAIVSARSAKYVV